MAIGPMTILWLERLARHGCFLEASTLLELGPQHFLVSQEFFTAFARRAVPNPDTFLSDTVANGRMKSDARIPFWSVFGIQTYNSLDLFHPEATYKVDLNNVMDADGAYSVVTNFGTAEHVFNIGAAFHTIHNLTAPGGVMLHILPAFGDINHGFYNIHPIVFPCLANVNGYEIVDFQYIDDVHGRTIELNGDPTKTLAFDSPSPRQVRPSGKVDYSYVAFRKILDLPFRYPQQE